MTRRENATIQILLFIARILAPSDWTEDIKRIATDISVNCKAE